MVSTGSSAKRDIDADMMILWTCSAANLQASVGLSIMCRCVVTLLQHPIFQHTYDTDTCGLFVRYCRGPILLRRRGGNDKDSGSTSHQIQNLQCSIRIRWLTNESTYIPFNGTEEQTYDGVRYAITQ